MLTGEILSLTVAVMWTFTAIFAEMASRRMGALPLNVWRMAVTIAAIMMLLWCTAGSPWPQYADGRVWAWMLASGFMGFVFGEYCLFGSYLLIGSRFGQLFMTLAGPFAALSSWLVLGESMSWVALLGMVVTVAGISISICARDEAGHRRVRLPVKGILLGLGAGMGQGVGLVLSKAGIQCYESLLPPDAAATQAMLPFAATMMRALMGLLGFGLMLLWQGRTRQLASAWASRRTALPALGAILLGPLFGVSLSLHAVHLTSAGVAQTLMSLTPVFILWPSHVFFGTPVRMREVAGATIAIAGASLFFL